MKIYTNTKFEGFWKGIPTAAVVCAENAENAAEILESELKRNLPHNVNVRPQDMIELNPEYESVRILSDGNY